MATNLLPLAPSVVRPYASSKPDASRRRNSSFPAPSAASSAKWWSPLFGWPSEPDYLGAKGEGGGAGSDGQDKNNRSRSEADLEGKHKHARSRFPPGCFTAEKARQLRMLTSDAASHHDAMYHSAIASRLATESNENAGK